MGLAMKKQVERYTYSDYLKWDDNERWEIINGEAFDMSPGPGTSHQLIVTQLIRQMSNQLEGKPCNVFTAPFDVRLPMGKEKEEDISDIVQPDISLVCDPGKLDEKGCLGAPDLIVEILSPSSNRRDRLEKFNLYEAAGVKEYWLVLPPDKIVEVFTLGKDGKYGRPGLFSESETIGLSIIKGLSIDLKHLFNTQISV
ncbi:MAG: Uma2 family endonuclease [bacterium]|nr:Uma2 family endonuclease [bacterium]